MSIALENQGIPQNPSIWLPSRAVEIANGRTTPQSIGDVLYLELTHLLANDAQSIYATIQGRPPIQTIGNRHTQSVPTERPLPIRPTAHTEVSPDSGRACSLLLELHGDGPPDNIVM